MEKMEIQYMSKPYGSYKRTWTALMKRVKQGKKQGVEFVSKRKPMSTMFMNTKTMEEYYYPELDGIVVHKNSELIKYKTAEEAFTAAKEIKEYLLAELANPNTDWSYVTS